MGEIYYKKVGRKYIPVSEEFTGFPKEGIWIISSSNKGKVDASHWSGFWMMRLGDTPSVMLAAAFARYQDVIASAVAKTLKWNRRSPMDIATEVVRAVAQYDEIQISQDKKARRQT